MLSRRWRQPAPRDLKCITNRMVKCKDFKLFKWSLGLSSILSSEQCSETTHILIVLSLISMTTEKCGVFLVKNDAPTFNVTLWSLRPCRMLVPLPISSSMPRWALCRCSLNCRVSSIGMVVSESCGESRDSVTCSLKTQHAPADTAKTRQDWHDWAHTCFFHNDLKYNIDIWVRRVI